uniref:Uncharacterized protein n=1 Tax=Anguilla anguilla TaxID=7936 RepID=A0A0E9TNN2_ANGAN
MLRASTCRSGTPAIVITLQAVCGSEWNTNFQRSKTFLSC